ncbi:MAG: radical SAM protein [Nitrosomonadales bacterium]|nr:radical SAM protein [Nitrosomonadales bacterium]
MKKIKVFSTQFNYQYGGVIHFPYSIASLVAYIKSFPDLDARFQFEKTFVFRNKFDEYVSRCADVDILLCSCYTWNWEITTRLAKAVKELNPGCLVIFGGPQVPLNYQGDVPLTWVEQSKGTFFADYPYVDMLVHEEGECTLKDIFAEYLGDKDYSKISGLETRNYKTPRANRIADLDMLPSPYLTNLVWDLVEAVEGVTYIASWETNRGCPFQCTYCDWGSATKTKVRKRDMEILLKEIDWFADNKIPYVDCCDANFGIFADRDLALARKFKEVKLAKGYPGRVRPAWVKASSERLIPIAKELLEADLLRAVTLAVQSLDPTTLKTVKRSNIKFDTFANLTQQFRDHKIETYTEFIMGMPGETLTSYKNGLEQLMELFPRPVVFVYNCGVFVNAPMNEPAYLEAYGIKVTKSPIYLWHSSIHNRGDIPEYEYITISANSFSLDDLKAMYLYGWTTQALHSMGILEYIAKFYNQVHGLKFIKFYETFIEYCQRDDASGFKTEFTIVRNYIDTGYAGGGWDHYDPDLAPIFWPIEEATWLRCVRDSQWLRREILDFLRYLEGRLEYGDDMEMIEDLVDFQVFLLSVMDRKEPVKNHVAKYAWKDFLLNGNAKIAELNRSPREYSWENKVTESDRAQWCYKAIWVGRNQGNYKCHLEHLNENAAG